MKRPAIAITMAILSSALYSYAQDAEFDLSSQRQESQLVPKVPGKKLDHKGMPLNPVPQEMNITGEGYIPASATFKIKDRNNAFSDELDFIRQDKKGLSLTLDFGEKAALKAGVKAIEGAYILHISEKGVSITGYDETGAFYGIQTLRQISESGRLPFMTINDWPDLKRRGVVEGFYGTPWSHEVRLSLIDFYGRFKMNTYLYGPKDDPYHSCPNWRLPYPEEDAAKIKELVNSCRRNRVDFVWAIHPGQDIKWNEEDFGNLLHKFDLMYELGVRSFAIFFDDISGEGTNPVKQAELLNRLNRDFVQAKGDVRPLIVCPTDYSKLWANPTPQGSLSIYGRELDPGIDIFWTGDFVCSDLTPETLEWINSRTKRPSFYWWNFPVTDYVRHIMMLGPAYGLDTTLSEKDLCGIVSNPMEHGEASKLGLYGVADYSWNVEAYNPLDNWERAIIEEVPEAQDAYRTFAIHSCDTETGYRRDESWETPTFRMDSYTEEEFNALRAEFEKITKVPAELENGCNNKLLLQEIKPWLEEFEKLGARGLRTLDLIKLYEKADYSDFWKLYTDNLMTDEELESYNAHKSGTLKLQPFYENAMDDLSDKFYFSLSGKKSSSVKGIGSFPNVYTTLSKLMFDNDSTTYYTSGESQGDGAWTGADLGELTPVKEIKILQGRNSVDDVDYYDHAVLEYSKDGREWTALIDDMKGQYVIEWKGEPVDARFVRLRRLESEKTNWASVRSFDINPVTAENLGFCIKCENPGEATKAFDRNLQTFYKSETLTMDRPEGITSMTVLTGTHNGEVTVRQLDCNGNEIQSDIASDQTIKINLHKDATCISINGSTDIYEIIFR